MPERIQQRGFRRGVTRTGLVLALAVLIVFAAVVVAFVIRSPSRATGDEALPTGGPAPDIKQLSSSASMSTVGGGGHFSAQIVARDDPSRLVGEIAAQRYEPLPDQRFKLEKPEGWAFLKNGWTAHIKADTGRTYMPDQTKGASPRDAILEGSVVIRLFAPREDGKRPNLDADQPFAVVTTTVLKFDGELGQVRLPEGFVLTSPIVEWTGEDLTLLYNEVGQRLEWLHVARTARLILHPDYREPERKPVVQPSPGDLTSAPTSPTPTAPIAGPPAPAKKPKPAEFSPITLYHMACLDRVHVEQSGRTIDAEKLDGWARLVDNALRPGAIAGMRTASAPHGATTAGDSVPSPAVLEAPAVARTEAQAANASQADPFGGFDDKSPVTLTFDGPLDIRPLSDAPGELAYNDVFVRFTSDAPGGVRFADPRSKATGTGTLLDYAATRRDIALASSEDMGVLIAQPGSGTARGRRYEVSLASGVAHARGAGVITADKKSGADDPGQKRQDSDAVDRSLSWEDQAEFQFLKNDKKEVTNVISEVSANGAVRATDGKGALTGNSLNARFTPVSTKASRLDHLQVVGSAKGEDGRGGNLSSDTLEVWFAPTPDKPEQSDPTQLTAQGSVVGERNGEKISSGRLRVEIARDGEKQLAVKRVEAAEQVAFDGKDGIHASGERLVADPGAGVAHVFGAGTRVSKEGTSITGDDITMWKADGRLKVASGGKLVHDGPVGDPNGAAKGAPAHVEVEWSREMEFEDVKGEARCLGDVEAVLTKEARPAEQAGAERDTVRAEEVHLTFTPAPAPKEGGAGAGPGAPKQERRLLSVETIGTLADKPDGPPATIESRRYAVAPAPGQQPVLERLEYLESARINVDNEKGTLKTPGPGKMLVVDRREAAQAKPPAGRRGPLDGGPGPRGSTRFEWKGAMSMDRPSGTVRMDDHVEILHRDGDGAVTELDCENLTAHVRETGGPDAGKPAESFTGQLLDADAQGAVFVKSGKHEMMADTLHYDAIKRLVIAKAVNGNLVQFFDQQPNGKSTLNTTAREIEWDLAKDTIDAKQPGPVVVPR
jgi:lipopolysaccharide export system protein LptA